MASQFPFRKSHANKENLKSHTSEHVFEAVKNNKENIPPNDSSRPRVFGQELLNISRKISNTSQTQVLTL